MIDEQLQTDGHLEHPETEKNTLAPTVQEARLIKYDNLCRALAEASVVDEVKEILDEVLKINLYARLAKNKQMERDAAAIRMRAERQLGEMMDAQRNTVGKAKGGQPHQRRAKATGLSENPVAPTLAEAGIDKNLAHRARNAAKLSEKEFEEEIAELRNGNRGTLDIRRAAKPMKRTVLRSDDARQVDEARNGARQSAKHARADTRQHDAVVDDARALRTGAEAAGDQPDPERPTQSEGADRHSITVSFTDLEFSQVVTLAERLGIPADAVVRRAVAELVVKHPPQAAQSDGGLDE